MLKPLRHSSPRLSHHGLMALAVLLVLTPGMLLAQPKPLHLNPVIAKLAEGRTVYGLNTGDLSLAYAREVARAPVDFVYADLEHNPLDFPSLHLFLMGMTDKAMVLQKGNLQPNVAAQTGLSRSWKTSTAGPGSSANEATCSARLE